MKIKIIIKKMQNKRIIKTNPTIKIPSPAQKFNKTLRSDLTQNNKINTSTVNTHTPKNKAYRTFTSTNRNIKENKNPKILIDKTSNNTMRYSNYYTNKDNSNKNLLSLDKTPKYINQNNFTTNSKNERKIMSPKYITKDKEISKIPVKNEIRSKKIE